MNQRPLRTLVPMLALVAAAAVPLLAQPATEAPVLRVRGAAEVRIVPDLAVVRLGVANEAQTAQEAQQAVNEASDAILDAVRRAGIDEQNVQTVRLVLSPIYSSRRQGDTQEPRIVGYRASNTVSVRAEDLSLVAPVIDAALDAGANQLEGVSFGLQDDQGVKQQALGRAIEEARERRRRWPLPSAWSWQGSSLSPRSRGSCGSRGWRCPAPWRCSPTHRHLSPRAKSRSVHPCRLSID